MFDRTEKGVMSYMGRTAEFVENVKQSLEC